MGAAVNGTAGRSLSFSPAAAPGPSASEGRGILVPMNLVPPRIVPPWIGPTPPTLYVGGVGPIQGGTIRGGTKFIGTKIPLPSDALGPGAAAGEKDKDRPAVPFTAAPIRSPASASDYESFAP